MTGGRFFYQRNTGQTCIMCDQIAETGDHVPPQGLYTTSLRNHSRLLKVPSCSSHNESTKLDDEYVRLVLATGSPNSRAAMLLFDERIMPNAKKQGGSKLMARLHEKMTPFFLKHPSGQLEERYKFEIDKPRLQRVVQKIAHGLYWHHNGHRIPDDYKVGTYGWNREWSEEEKVAIVQIPVLSLGHPDVFQYRYGEVEGNKNKVYIAMRFFSSNLVEVTIHHKDFIPEMIKS